MIIGTFKTDRNASEIVKTSCERTKMILLVPPPILQPVLKCTLDFKKTVYILCDEELLHSVALSKT